MTFITIPQNWVGEPNFTVTQHSNVSCHVLKPNKKVFDCPQKWGYLKYPLPSPIISSPEYFSPTRCLLGELRLPACLFCQLNGCSHQWPTAAWALKLGLTIKALAAAAACQPQVPQCHMQMQSNASKTRLCPSKNVPFLRRVLIRSARVDFRIE